MWSFLLLLVACREEGEWLWRKSPFHRPSDRIKQLCVFISQLISQCEKFLYSTFRGLWTRGVLWSMKFIGGEKLGNFGWNFERLGTWPREKRNGGTRGLQICCRRNRTGTCQIKSYNNLSFEQLKQPAVTLYTQEARILKKCQCHLSDSRLHS